MKMNTAIIAKTKPVMPLTSLGDNGMPDWFQVTSEASTNKIAANIKISNPIATLSIFKTSFHLPRNTKILFPCYYLKSFVLSICSKLPECSFYSSRCLLLSFSYCMCIDSSCRNSSL